MLAFCRSHFLFLQLLLSLPSSSARPPPPPPPLPASTSLFLQTRAESSNLRPTHAGGDGEHGDERHVKAAEAGWGLIAEKVRAQNRICSAR